MQIYDSHVDTPSQLIRLRNIGIDNRYGHVDFPKLRRGGVGGSFFALYTPAEMAPDAATRYADAGGRRPPAGPGVNII